MIRSNLMAHCKYQRGTESCSRAVFTSKGYCKRHASGGGVPILQKLVAARKLPVKVEQKVYPRG